MANSYGTSIAERLGSPVAQWQQAMQTIAKRIRVAMPAIVQSFDPASQTVVVSPAVHEEERVAGVLTTVQLPDLHDVPVLIPRGGGFSFTVPIAAGDECLVVFADQCIDAWWEAGSRQRQPKQRRHALADAFAVFGPWSKPRHLSSYSTSSAQLRNDAGDTVIDLQNGQVSITAATVNVHATGTATVQGSTVNVTGSSAVHISGNGSTSIEGKDWLTHKHTGVQTGGGTSGPVL